MRNTKDFLIKLQENQERSINDDANTVLQRCYTKALRLLDEQKRRENTIPLKSISLPLNCEAPF